jgi:tRNA-splicing ligase RtcB
MGVAKQKGQIYKEITWLDIEESAGAEYLELMNLAGEYAYAGRDYVCAKVAKILKAEVLEEVHNHHNFAWKETHDGEDYYVVRKGATPAFPGQMGFVGGSMGDFSYILRGVESEKSKAALYSTVHGAGRTTSRTAAKGKKGQGGLVTKEMMSTWLRKQNVVLRGADVDESPHCYKRIDDVLGHHEGPIEVIHKLKPLGVAMAGKDIRDPYKD